MEDYVLGIFDHEVKDENLLVSYTVYIDTDHNAPVESKDVHILRWNYEIPLEKLDKVHYIKLDEEFFKSFESWGDNDKLKLRCEDYKDFCFNKGTMKVVDDNHEFPLEYNCGPLYGARVRLR